jgi:hypothetical protein
MAILFFQKLWTAAFSQISQKRGQESRTVWVGFPKTLFFEQKKCKVAVFFTLKNAIWATKSLMAFLGLSLASCQDCTFISDNVQSVRLEFATPLTQTAKDTLLQARIIGLIPGSLTPMRKAVDIGTSGRKTFDLRLFTRYDTTVYRFAALADTLPDDTLMLRYRKEVIILPPDCGYDEAISDLEVIYHTFDSVKVLNTRLQVTNTTSDIRIFD